MTKTVKISNVRGNVCGERRTFDVQVRVNAYNRVVAGMIEYPEGRRGFLQSPHISMSLEAKIVRLARKAVRNGQELVDWSAR